MVVTSTHLQWLLQHLYNGYFNTSTMVRYFNTSTMLVTSTPLQWLLPTPLQWILQHLYNNFFNTSTMVTSTPLQWLLQHLYNGDFKHLYNSTWTIDVLLCELLALGLPLLDGLLFHDLFAETLAKHARFSLSDLKIKELANKLNYQLMLTLNIAIPFIIFIYVLELKLLKFLPTRGVWRGVYPKDQSMCQYCNSLYNFIYVPWT